jgi:hypothetical protein
MRQLRPSLGRRLPYLVGCVLALALCVAALFFSPLVAAAGVLLFGFAAVNAAVRMFNPRSYATHLDADGFTAFSARGRPVHVVRWEQVAHLTFFNGNGFGGPGTVLHLAWRCAPRCPGNGRQPWVRGGRNSAGEEFDGALPDPYLGIEPMLALFSRYAAGPGAAVGGTGSLHDAPLDHDLARRVEPAAGTD